MNVLIYWFKRDFDSQRAERFFKERRVPLQIVDLKKHALGASEAALFARCIGAKALLDRNSMAVRSHPVAYTDDPDLIMDYLVRFPQFLRLPIVRCGNRITVGIDEPVWTQWLNALPDD
jgi:arsenate reductase (glutaredoxin)